MIYPLIQETLQELWMSKYGNKKQSDYDYWAPVNGGNGEKTTTMKELSCQGSNL